MNTKKDVTHSLNEAVKWLKHSYNQCKECKQINFGNSKIR